MTDETAAELARALEYARVVAAVLPADEEADAMATRLLNRNRPESSYRILRKRAP